MFCWVMKIFNHTQYQYKQNNTQPPYCHAELDSASDRSAKSHPTFGLSGKSMQAIPMGKTLNQVQGDSSLCAYMQGDSLYFHPNINCRISFGALKKSQFDGLDLAVVEKFKAPIEKFNSNDDLQDWAKGQAESIANTDFGGRQKETVIQRKAMLKEWSDYVLKENDAYNNATALLILNAVTKDLKPDNDKLPPVLNKGVLADCISEIDKNTKADKKYQFDLNKMYETKLRALYLEDAKTENGNTGWVVIPSKSNDPENFEQNVEKLKTLSHKNWCTKSFNAEPYLSQGDFHVYLENGQPKLGVRFFDDWIQEIQGELNNGKIPISYFDELKKHIDENGLLLTANAKKEIKTAQEVKAEVEIVRQDLENEISSNDVKGIFKYFGINAKEDEDGFLTLSEYKQPSEKLTFLDIGIDENVLFEKVKRIDGDANFQNSNLKNLKKLETIYGDADFSNSQITDLGNLQSIGGNADFVYSEITDLGNLQSIGSNAYFSFSKITNLGNLQSIGQNADFEHSQITNLGNLQSIGNSANFRNSQITNLGNLETIGRKAFFVDSKVTNLGKLRSIGGRVISNNLRLD